MVVANLHIYYNTPKESVSIQQYSYLYTNYVNSTKYAQLSFVEILKNAYKTRLICKQFPL